MANKFTDFIKKNAAQNASGMGGVLLGASAIASIASGESALKVFGNTLKEVIFGMASFKLVGASMFFGMGKGIRSLVIDTGSLQAAIDKLKTIQGLHKIFEPLVGGAKAAKLEVAKLVNFSSSKGLKLDDVAQGARNLKILTRDAYSGTEALSAIADAAAGTGSSVSDMASAVGQFSATLRSGGSITGASEQLRQMGVISQSTADSMTRLQDNGASSTQVFSVLTAALGTFAGGAEKSKGSIAGINAAYDSAISSLQQKFGSPFVESDTQNTKNWTDALTAIAPVVESLSGFLNILFGGLSNLGSWFAKTTAESSSMRSIVVALVKGLALLVTVVSVVSAVSLAAWLLAASSGMVLFTGSTMLATLAVRGLGLAIAATGIGLLLVLVGTAVGVFMQYSSSMDEAKKAQEDLNAAHKESMNLLQKQIDMVTTLADQHHALAAAIAAESAAQDELNKAKMKNDPEAIAAAKKRLDEAKVKVENVATMDKTRLEGTDVEAQQRKDKVTRERQDEERSHQKDLAEASPERKIELLKERSSKLKERSILAAKGDEASLSVSKKRDQIGTEKTKADSDAALAQKNITAAEARSKKGTDDIAAFENSGSRAFDWIMGGMQTGFDDEGGIETEQMRKARNDNQMVKQAEREKVSEGAALKEAQERQKNANLKLADLGRTAPLGTYERLNYEANDMANSEDPDRIPKTEKLRMQAAEALNDQKSRGTSEAAAKDADAAVKAAEEEQAAAKIQLETETAIANLKTEGYERAQDELDLALKRIEAERALEKNKGEGYTSQAKLDKFDNEKKNTELQKETNRRAQEKSVATADLEGRLAGSGKRGYAAQDEAANEKLKSLKDQYNKAPLTGEGMRERQRLDTEAKGIRKSQGDSMVSRAQMGIGVGMELAQQKANISGDAAKAEEIENFKVSKDKYDQLIAQGVDEPTARTTAKQFGENAIALNAMKSGTNFNSSIAGDSLARIGGGGNVAAGESPELNVAKQSQKNLENIDKYIVKLVEERSKGELTAL